MVPTTIVNGVYKQSYGWGAPHYKQSFGSDFMFYEPEIQTKSRAAALKWVRMAQAP